MAGRAGADRRADYVELLREVTRLGMNVVAVSSDAVRWDAMAETRTKERRIDVWWKDDDSSRLALLMAYLFTRTDAWSRAKIRLLATASADGDQVGLEAELNEMLDEARIPAAVHLIAPNVDAAAAACGDATLVMVPARLRRDEILDPLNEDLYALFDRLPVAAAVVAGSPVDLVAGPESGEHSQIPDAEERVEAAESRLKRLETQFAKIDGELADLRVKAERNGSEEDEAKLDAAEARHTTLTRRLLKARALTDRACAELAELLESSSQS